MARKHQFCDFSVFTQIQGQRHRPQVKGKEERKGKMEDKRTQMTSGRRKAA
jgi:hypothetical protein